MTKQSRKTKESDINIALEIYGEGASNIDTKIGFFDHMLESFAKHALINLELKTVGDLHVDFHHSVEDTGIVLGLALKDEIYPIENVERFADSVVVMDECAISCALDLSNRPFFVFDVPNLSGKVGEFDCELVEEFFRAVAFNTGITLHMRLISGKNLHHICEACFKAFAICLRRALVKNARVGIPSTKGVL